MNPARRRNNSLRPACHISLELGSYPNLLKSAFYFFLQGSPSFLPTGQVDGEAHEGIKSKVLYSQGVVGADMVEPLATK